MLSYRHHFHAGNFADCMKHSIYCLLLRALVRKPSPIFVLDTHAGAGSYDLTSTMAQKTREFEHGIAPLLLQAHPPAAMHPYLEIVRAMNVDQSILKYYPGSPRIAFSMLRSQDYLALCELHSTDSGLLRSEFEHVSRVSIRHEDGYQAMRALLPPIQRRGMVFIDPAFEIKNEFDRLGDAFKHSYSRWSSGVFAIWFPIRSSAENQAWLLKLTEMNIRKLLLVELRIMEDSSESRLGGSGMIIANPPWGIEEELNSILPWLWSSLSQERCGGWSVRWLTPE